MARRPIRILVLREDRQALNELLSSGMQPVRVVLRALALLHLADGSTAPDTARSLKKLTAKTVRLIAHRYREGGLERARASSLRKGAAGRGSFAEPFGETAYCRYGLRRSTRRLRSLDRPSDRRGSG